MAMSFKVEIGMCTPQGSVIGLFHFLIYINHVVYCKFCFFVDELFSAPVFQKLIIWISIFFYRHNPAFQYKWILGSVLFI